MSQQHDIEIQSRFKVHREELRQLFADDLSKSQRFQINWRSYLRHLFEQVEVIIGMEQVWDFHLYLQNEDNVPVHIDTSQFHFGDFQEMLGLWLEHKKGSSNLVESIYLSEEEHPQRSFRNWQFEDVLKNQRHTIINYTATLADRKKLSEDELVQLIKQLFKQYFVYESNEDIIPIIDKPTFNTTVLQIIKNYKHTQRELKPSGNKELTLVSELPALLKYWQDINPQIQVEVVKRNSTEEFAVQTDNAPSLHYKQTKDQAAQTPVHRYPEQRSVSPKQFYRKNVQKNSIEYTINDAIDQLQRQRQSVLNPDWLESIDYLLITLLKERRRMYPHYRHQIYNPCTVSAEQAVKSEEPYSVGRKLDSWLDEIYEHYRANKQRKTDEKDLQFSFLGEYGEEAVREQRKNEPLNQEDFRLFLHDIGQFTGQFKIASSVRKSSKINRSIINTMTLDVFKSMMKELIIKKKNPAITESSIIRFVMEQIKGNKQKKITINIKEELQTPKEVMRVKMLTPISNSPKKSKGSTGNTLELLQPPQTYLLYSGREEVPEFKKKKAINSPAYRKRLSKNQPIPFNVNNVSDRKKDPYSPYRIRQVNSSFNKANELAEGCVSKKKGGKGSAQRESQNWQ